MDGSNLKCCNSSKDVIIEVLQNQVKNFQELYKQTENEKDGLRNKIIDTQKEIGRLKKILENRKNRGCSSNGVTKNKKEDKIVVDAKKPIKEEMFTKKTVNPVMTPVSNQPRPRLFTIDSLKLDPVVSEAVKIESKKVPSNQSLRTFSWVIVDEPQKESKQIEAQEKEMQVTFLSTPHVSKTSVQVQNDLIIGPEPGQLKEKLEKPIQTERIQLDNMENHLQILTDDIHRLNKQMQVKNNLINMLEKKVATTQMSLTLENTKLEEKLARLKLELNDYISKEDKWKEDKSKMIELIKNLQEQLIEYQVISKELMGLKKENTLLEHEKNQLVNEIESLAQDMKHLKEDHVSAVEELKRAYDVKFLEKAEELAKLDIVNTEYVMKINELEGMVKNLESQLEQKDEGIADLKLMQEQQINELKNDIAKSEKKIEAYKEALDKLEQERSKLEQQIVDMEMDKREVVKEMEEKNKEFEEKLVNLENDYRNLNEMQKNEHAEKIKEMQGTIDDLESKLSEEQKVLNTAVADLSNLGSENIYLKKQNEELTQQVENTQQIALKHIKDNQFLINSLTEENAKYKKDNESLQDQLVRKEELINELQAINKEVQERQTNQFSEIFIDELAKVHSGNMQLIDNFSILLGKIDKMHSQGDSNKDVLVEMDKLHKQIVTLSGKVDGNDLNNLILKIMERLSQIEQEIVKQCQYEPNDNIPVKENLQLNKDINCLQQQINSLCLEKETILLKMHELQKCAQCDEMSKIISVFETENRELVESNANLKSQIAKLQKQLDILQDSNSKLQAENETVRKIIGSATSLQNLSNMSMECLQRYVSGELIKKDSLIRNLELSLHDYKEIVQECEMELKNLKKKNDMLNDLYNEIKNKYQSVASNT